MAKAHLVTRTPLSTIRRIARWTLLAVLVLVLIVAAVPWWVVARDWLDRDDYRSWLQRNVQPLDPEAPEADLAFDPSFYDNRLFLLGEIHGAAAAQVVDLAMMKHLNRRAGVRWIMAELDYSQAERFNAYLETGDESLVRPVFDAWLARSAQWGNAQHFDKLRALREYNRSLPRERRLRYFGVDRVHDVDTAALWLGRMLADLDQGTADSLVHLKTLIESGWTNDAALADALRAALDALAGESAGRPVGIDARAAAHLARNMLRAIEGDGRYAVVLDNIGAMVDEFGIGDEEPMYGFWGIFHVLQVPVGGARPLAMRLRSGGPFADRVASIGMIYAGSHWNLPSRLLPAPIRPESRFVDAPLTQANPYLQYLRGIGHALAAAGDARLALFRVAGPGSPYPADGRLVTQTGLLTRLFPFEVEAGERMPSGHLILVRDSPAVDAFR